MKRQKMQLMILAVLLAVLAGSLMGIRQYNRKQAQKDAELAKEGDLIIDAAYGDVVKFSYEYEGESCAFEKIQEGEEQVWYVEGDHSVSLKQSMVNSILNGALPLRAKQTIENVTDKEQYGLAHPQRTITFETSSANYTLYVGEENTLTGTYYVALPSEDKVYLVDKAEITRYNYPLENLIEEPAEEESIEEEPVEEESTKEEPSEEKSAEEESTKEEPTGEESTEEELNDEESAE